MFQDEIKKAREYDTFVVYMVRLPGFEPGLEAWEASVLDQTRPQPQRFLRKASKETKLLMLLQKIK